MRNDFLKIILLILAKKISVKSNDNYYETTQNSETIQLEYFYFTFFNIKK